MLRYELHRIPLTRYMMLYLDWKKVSLHHRILLLHGMEKTIRLKHGTLDQTLQSAMASSVTGTSNQWTNNLVLLPFTIISRKSDMEIRT